MTQRDEKLREAIRGELFPRNTWPHGYADWMNVQVDKIVERVNSILLAEPPSSAIRDVISLNTSILEARLDEAKWWVDYWDFNDIGDAPDAHAHIAGIEAAIRNLKGAAQPDSQASPAPLTGQLDGLIDQVLMSYAAGCMKPRIKEICEKWLADGSKEGKS